MKASEHPLPDVLEDEPTISFFHRGNLDMALRAAESEIRSNQDPSCSRYWYFRFIRAQVLSILGFVEESASYLDSVGAPCPEDVESVISLSMHKAYMLAMLGNYSGARELLASAEIRTSTLHLSKLQSEITVRRGMVAYLEGDFSSALDFYQGVVHAAGNAHGQYLNCVAITGAGKALAAMKRFAEAVNWLEKSLRLSQMEGFDLLRAGILSEMGSCNLGIGDTESSLRLFLESSRVLFDLKARRFYPANSHDLGVAYFIRGDYALAVSYFLRAVGGAIQMKNRTAAEQYRASLQLSFRKLMEKNRQI
jgi:tetratricopeptide (TPR) repeat protein